MRDTGDSDKRETLEIVKKVRHWRLCECVTLEVVKKVRHWRLWQT